MIVFLLFSIPVFYILFSVFLQYEKKGFPFNFTAFSKGILWFFPSLILFLIISGFFQLSYKPFNYYFYYFMRDHFLFCVLGIAGYFIFHGFSHSHDIKDPFLNLFSFFSGFFMLVAVKDFFAFSGEATVYLLFILPFLRLFIILIVSFLMDKFMEGLGLEKILFGGLLFLVPVCAGFISFFYNINLSLLAFLLSIGLFAGAGAASYFLKDF